MGSFGIEYCCAAAGCATKAATVPVATSIAARADTESSVLLGVVQLFVILSSYIHSHKILLCLKPLVSCICI